MKKLTLPALLAATLAGHILIADKGDTLQVQLVDEPSGVELTGDAKSPLVTKLAESEAKGVVLCKLGGASNYPELYYCSDGARAGFLLEASVAEDVIAETDADGAKELVLATGEGGKVYAKAVEAKEAAAGALDAKP